MAAYKEALDQLARQQRRRIIGGIVLGLVLLTVLGGISFVFYVPAKIREVTGTIVNFGTHASDSEVTHYIVVKLEQGPTVKARFHGGGAMRIGRRVKLEEATTLLIGWKRYTFKQLMDEPVSRKKAIQKKTGRSGYS